VLDALAGPDARDPATLSQPLEQFAREPRAVRGMRIALPPTEQLPAFMDAGVIDAWEAAARTFESLGVVIERTRLPAEYFDLSVATGCIIASEAYALHRAYVNDPNAALGPAVRKRMLAAEGLAPATYAEELRTMAARRRVMADWFEPFDAVLLPTVAIPAPAVTDADEDSPLPGYLTRPANYLGLCALSQPAGLVRGLPAGIQLVGKPWAEHTVLSLGQAFESATTHHAVHPDLRSFGLDA
jgi:aspartyl-tRNA(Asn)/glutamyl-tRNA(Gln) amidotransferase subunit A